MPLEELPASCFCFQELLPHYIAWSCETLGLDWIQMKLISGEFGLE